MAHNFPQTGTPTAAQFTNGKMKSQKKTLRAELGINGTSIGAESLKLLL